MTNYSRFIIRKLRFKDANQSFRYHTATKAISPAPTPLECSREAECRQCMNYVDRLARIDREKANCHDSVLKMGSERYMLWIFHRN